MCYRIIFLLCCFLFASMNASLAQNLAWEKLSPKIYDRLSNVYFLNADTGFVGGNDIYRTTDGGATWKTVYEPASSVENYVTDFWFFDDLHGLATAMSDENYLLETIDGGESWIKRSYESGNLDGPIDIEFFTPDTGCIITHKGGFVRTVDGGRTWKVVAPSPFHDAFYLKSVQTVNARTGYVSGAGQHLYQTNDAGYSWQAYALPLRPSYDRAFVRSLQFFSSDTGVMLIDHGDLQITTDGAQSWKRLDSLTSEAREAHFLTPDSGYVFTYGSPSRLDARVSFTKNRCENWDKLGERGAESAVFFVNHAVSYAVDIGGRIVKTTDGWRTQEEVGNPVALDVFGGHFLSDAVGVLAAQGLRLYRTEDEGEN